MDILHLSVMISVRQAHNGQRLGSSAVVLRDEVVKTFTAIVADSQSASPCCGVCERGGIEVFVVLIYSDY